MPVSISGSSGISGASGMVLQVQSTTKTDFFTSTNTSFVDIDGLFVNITPKFSNSQILIMCNVSGAEDTSVAQCYLRVTRNGVAIGVGTEGVSRRKTFGGLVVDAAYTTRIGNNSFNFLDSPSTTSQLTYSVQVATDAGTAYINRSKTDADSGSRPSASSTITVMEIAA